uniref:Uncharacterized protein n=1 Tax=Strigamia maritima TaxID=126957 RepID=T1IKZ3_STRMM
MRIRCNLKTFIQLEKKPNHDPRNSIKLPSMQDNLQQQQQQPNPSENIGKLQNCTVEPVEHSAASTTIARPQTATRYSQLHNWLFKTCEYYSATCPSNANSLSLNGCAALTKFGFCTVSFIRIKACERWSRS